MGILFINYCKFIVLDHIIQITLQRNKNKHETATETACRPKIMLLLYYGLRMLPITVII